MERKETAYWKRRHPQGIQGDVEPKKPKPVAKRNQIPGPKGTKLGRNVIIKNPALAGGGD